ncbi:MAG: DJ-1/PfpI family protein [Candidatus Acidiferrum sp.]
MKQATIIVVLIGFVATACLTPILEAKQQSVPGQGQKRQRNLAILIFEGVQIIDYTGPYETFGHVYSFDQPIPFNVYTVAEKPDALTTWMGMSVNPKYSFDNAPQPDILVIPGGDVRSAINNPRLIAWVQNSVRNAEIVMSVCNGAFFLAKAGLLDGLEATTTANLIERLKAAAPKTRVVSDRRFVDNGKIITTAGLSSGIDGSLHIIERLYGRGTAEIAALAMEYDWDPESKYSRAALADRYMPSNYDIDSMVNSLVPVSRSGAVDHWETKWSATSKFSPAGILQHLEEALSHSDYFPRAKDIKWVKQSEAASSHEAESLWKFADERGHLWNGRISVAAVDGQKDTYLLTVGVKKGMKVDLK